MHPSDLESMSPLWQLRLHWSISAAQLSVAGAIMVPVYYQFFKRWKTHHPIVQASLTLVLPDVFLILNFLPLEAMNLHSDFFAANHYCTFSAFATISGILASNAGVIFIAYTTWAVIVKQQRKTNLRALIGVQVVGWALGLALALYFYFRDYLGVYMGLYCCTKTKDQLDVVLPVFLTFFVASGAMTFFYWRTFKHIRAVQQAAEVLKNRGATGRAAGVQMVASAPAAQVDASPRLPPMPRLVLHDPPPRDSPRPLASPTAQGSADPIASPRATAAEADVASPAVADGGEPPVPARWASLSAASPVHAPQVAGNSLPPLHTRLSPPQQGRTVAVRGSGMVLAVPDSPSGSSVEGVGAFVMPPNSGAGLMSPVAAALKPAAQVSKERKSRDVALAMLLRGMGLIGCYYFCWFLVSLNGALALGGYKFVSLWPEMVAAWLIKLSPIIDALILGDLMRRAKNNAKGTGGGGGGMGGGGGGRPAPMHTRLEGGTRITQVSSVQGDRIGERSHLGDLRRHSHLPPFNNPRAPSFSAAGGNRLSQHGGLPGAAGKRVSGAAPSPRVTVVPSPRLTPAQQNSLHSLHFLSEQLDQPATAVDEPPPSSSSSVAAPAAASDAAVDAGASIPVVTLHPHSHQLPLSLPLSPSEAGISNRAAVADESDLEQQQQQQQQQQQPKGHAHDAHSGAVASSPAGGPAGASWMTPLEAVQDGEEAHVDAEDDDDEDEEAEAENKV